MRYGIQLKTKILINNRQFKIIIKRLVVCWNQPMIDYNRSSEQHYNLVYGGFTKRSSVCVNIMRIVMTYIIMQKMYTDLVNATAFSRFIAAVILRIFRLRFTLQISPRKKINIKGMCPKIRLCVICVHSYTNILWILYSYTTPSKFGEKSRHLCILDEGIIRHLPRKCFIYGDATLGC